LLGLADGGWLRAVLAAEGHHDIRLVDVAGDEDRQLQFPDRLFEPLAADAEGQHPKRRQEPVGPPQDLAIAGRRIAGRRDAVYRDAGRRDAGRRDAGLIVVVIVVLVVRPEPGRGQGEARDRQAWIGRSRVEQFEIGQTGLGQVERVDRGGAFVGLQCGQRTGGLVAPGSLALTFAQLPGAPIGRRRGTPFEGAAIGDLAGDERAVRDGTRRSGTWSTPFPAAWLKSKPLAGHHPRDRVTRPAGPVYSTARACFPGSPAAGLAPAAAGPRSVARAIPTGRRPGRRIAVTAGPIGALTPPARLHPPRAAAADQAGEALAAEGLARRRSGSCLGPVDALLITPAKLRRDR